MALLWPLAGRRGRADVMGMTEADGDGTGSCRLARHAGLCSQRPVPASGSMTVRD